MKRIPLIFLQLMKWKLSNLIYFLILLGKFYFFLNYQLLWQQRFKKRAIPTYIASVFEQHNLSEKQFAKINE